MSEPTVNIEVEVGNGEDSNKMEAIISRTSDRTGEPDDAMKFDLSIETDDGELIIAAEITDFTRVLKFLNETSGSAAGGF